jgi:hypothetical protein
VFSEGRYGFMLWDDGSNAKCVSWQEPPLPVLVSDLDFPPVAVMTPLPLPPSLLLMQCDILIGQRVSAVLL